MKAHHFTSMIASLLTFMEAKGYYCILKDANRSRYEQHRLYKIGRDEYGNTIPGNKILTKCDGINKISAHQYEDSGGRYAVDIYIHDGDGIIGKEAPYHIAHSYWESIGGDPPISWGDANHFEAHQGKGRTT